MRVAVKLFAAGRELVGADEAVVDAPEGSTVGDLRQTLARQFTVIAALVSRSLVAVNAEYAGDATKLATGDEVALIPPVSGG